MQSKSSPRRSKVPGKTGIYRRPDGTLEFFYRDSDKRTRWVTAKSQTVSGAVAERGDILARMHKGERIAPTGQTFSQVEPLWRANLDVAPRSRKRYASLMDVHCLPYFGNRRIQDINTADVADFVVYLRPRLKGSTASITVGVLGQVFQFAVRRGIIQANPVRNLERSERPRKEKRLKRVPEPEELQRLLAEAPESGRLIFDVLAFTGLRIGEALGLRWQDIDFQAGYIRPRQQFIDGQVTVLKTEAGRQREIVLALRLASTLKAHRLASLYSQDEDLVFPNANGQPRHAGAVLTLFNRAADRAGLNGDGHRKFVLHDLRHHFATVLIGSGADVVHVARQLGHSDVSVTLNTYADEYARVAHAERSREALDAAMEKILVSNSGKSLQT